MNDIEKAFWIAQYSEEYRSGISLPFGASGPSNHELAIERANEAVKALREASAAFEVKP